MHDWGDSSMRSLPTAQRANSSAGVTLYFGMPCRGWSQMEENCPSRPMSIMTPGNTITDAAEAGSPLTRTQPVDRSTYVGRYLAVSSRTDTPGNSGRSEIAKRTPVSVGGAISLVSVHLVCGHRPHTAITLPASSTSKFKSLIKIDVNLLVGPGSKSKEYSSGRYTNTLFGIRPTPCAISNRVIMDCF